MRTATFGLLVLLPLWLASCGPARMPPTFLHTESKAWNQWLDSDTHYGSFSGFTVRDILRAVAGPADLAIQPSPALGRRVAHADMKGLTVREALWKVSNEQGVKLTLAVTHEPRTFLGAGETEIQRKGPAGVTTTTEVMQGDLQEYQKLKAEKQIYREEVQDGTLYYAVAVNRDLPFPGGVSAWVTEIQRYKIPAPKTP